MMIFPDRLDDGDTQIYGQASFCYESMWLGLMRVYHRNRAKSYKQTTIELTASRDGRHFTRVGKREEVIPLGKPDDWDAHYHTAVAPILVGQELWIYYGSTIMGENSGINQHHQIGLAKLRRDGFVSMNAGGEIGIVAFLLFLCRCKVPTVAL